MLPVRDYVLVEALAVAVADVRVARHASDKAGDVVGRAADQPVRELRPSCMYATTRGEILRVTWTQPDGVVALVAARLTVGKFLRLFVQSVVQLCDRVHRVS